GLEDLVAPVGAVGGDDAGRRVDRRAALGALGGHTAVHLAPNVIVQVIVTAARGVRRLVQSVRPRGDGLRAVRLVVPVPQQLFGDDALEVAVDVHVVHDIEPALRGGDEAVAAAVGRAVDRDGALAVRLNGELAG